MTSIEVLITEVSGLQRGDLERWISNEWVKADRQSGVFVFTEIDVARVKLIQQLREEMDINEESMPLILSLLDQLYDLRRRMQALSDTIAQTTPEHVQRELTSRLVKHPLDKLR